MRDHYREAPKTSGPVVLPSAHTFLHAPTATSTISQLLSGLLVVVIVAMVNRQMTSCVLCRGRTKNKRPHTSCLCKHGFSTVGAAPGLVGFPALDSQIPSTETRTTPSFSRTSRRKPRTPWTRWLPWRSARLWPALTRPRATLTRPTTKGTSVSAIPLSTCTKTRPPSSTLRKASLPSAWNRAFW